MIRCELLKGEMEIPCPFEGCNAILLFDPSRTRTGISLRQRARSAVRSHLLRHYQLRQRERSLLLDEAVEGL